MGNRGFVQLIEKLARLFGLKRTKQPEGLLSVLLDGQSDDDDRIEATMRLHEYKSTIVEAGLLQVINDPKSSDELVENCRDSLFLLKK